MCGVLGILGGFPLQSARELLLLLTHRGQDASGLLWTDKELFKSKKTIGSPALLELPNKSMSLILGSTRYPTTGRKVSSEAELETFAGPFHSGKIALTHNGNITNMTELADNHYDCDSEFILDSVVRYLDDTNGLVDAFKRVDKEIDGSYSLVGIYEDSLFAYRDRHGFKPLVFGRTNERTVVASESTVLDMADVPLERDVYPGELLIFGQDGSMQSYSVSQSASHYHCFFEYVYFANPASTIENQLVYDTRFRLGRALANTFKRMSLETPDYVVPVPDTSRPAAQALAESLGVPMREIILKNRYLGRTFILKSQDERNSTAKNKYIYLDGKIRGKIILVVDDSIVRGTTAKMIVKDLKKKGAAQVYFAATCPPQTNPCYYGIDIASDRELIASNNTVEVIAAFIGADALIYQDMDGLANAIGLKDLCLACLDGVYPTEHARKIRELVREADPSSERRDYERDFEG